jgi:ketosteroid isomerase-like protein
MSQETLEVVRTAYEAWARGDLEAALEVAAPDIVIKQPPTQADARSYVGHDGLRRATADWGGQWDDWRIEIRRLIDADPLVVATIHQRGRGKASGVQVGTELSSVHAVEAGKITRMEMFFSEEEALEAAGLPE